MKVTHLGIIAFFLFSMSVAGRTRAADQATTLPSGLDSSWIKIIDDNIGVLVDGSDDDKQLAEDRLYNVPLLALPYLETGAKRPGMDAESRQRLVRVIGNLQGLWKREEALEAIRRQDSESNQRTALEAYERCGRHDPKWDDLARTGIRQFTSRFASERAAGYVTLEHVTSDLKCDDPLIWYFDARDLETDADEERDPARKSKRLWEAMNTYGSACEAFEKSTYPADRKCFALAHAASMIMNTSASKNPTIGAAAKKYADESLALFPDVAKTPGITERWLTEPAGLIVDAQVACGADRGAVTDKIYPILDRALPGRPSPLVFKGHQYTRWGWDARGMGYANTVTAEGSKLMAQRLSMAEAALEKAYELSPSDPAAAVEMLTVELGQGKGRDVMEKWFRRAIAADPESEAAYQAKLYYLEPKWYGTPQDMLNFGHQCLATRNWRAHITNILLEAHLQLAAYAKDETAYWHDPSVWKDVQSVVEHEMEMFPTDPYYRSWYAYWAWKCGHWAIANSQFKQLGEKLNGSFFDNDPAKIEQARMESAKNAGRQ